jgi:hypothetical protein
MTDKNSNVVVVKTRMIDGGGGKVSDDAGGEKRFGRI